MKFSILTPSYGYARFLPAAIQSVASQAVDVEHLIWDGGSTDGTVELLQTASQPLRWVSEPDGGQSDALNKALAHAGGDVVGWLNADDFYLPGAFRAVLDHFEAHPEVDVVHGDGLFVDGAGRLSRMLASYDVPYSVLRRRGCVVLSTTAFIRRRVLPDRVWDTDLRVVMDWDLFLGLAERGARFGHVERPLAAFRLHESQVTSAPIDRNSDEHRRVRGKHGIATRTPRTTNLVGDVHHKLLKWSGGATKRERCVAGLEGVPLLGPTDDVDITVFERVLAASAG